MFDEVLEQLLDPLVLIIVILYGLFVLILHLNQYLNRKKRVKNTMADIESYRAENYPNEPMKYEHTKEWAEKNDKGLNEFLNEMEAGTDE